MAIAALPQKEQFELVEIPWPKPTLRLVTESSIPAAVCPTVVEAEDRAVVQLQPGPSARRSTSTRVRRRRLAVVLGVLATLVILALPLQLIGSRTVTGQLAPGGITTGLPDGSVYVVQPGDSLTSIAHRINPGGDQAALIRALRTTVGSPVVVPGEHIVLP